jgi:hypothetical protein
MLRTLGAPEAAINYLPDSESWSTGCGAYAFWGSNAHIVYAIVGGDPDMMPALQRCIVTGILNGFGLRSGIKEFVTSPDDYLQYMLLARALARCDQNDTLQVVQASAPSMNWTGKATIALSFMAVPKRGHRSGSTMNIRSRCPRRPLPCSHRVVPQAQSLAWAAALARLCS